MFVYVHVLCKTVHVLLLYRNTVFYTIKSSVDKDLWAPSIYKDQTLKNITVNNILPDHIHTVRVNMIVHIKINIVNLYCTCRLWYQV